MPQARQRHHGHSSYGLVDVFITPNKGISSCSRKLLHVAFVWTTRPSRLLETRYEREAYCLPVQRIHQVCQDEHDGWGVALKA